MNLNEIQQDSLQEYVNIGVGRAASVLNEMVDSHITLQVPKIDVIPPQEALLRLEKRLNGENLAAVRLRFDGMIGGNAQLVFPISSASQLVSVLTGEDRDSPDLDAMRIGTLTEVGNIVINSVIGSMGNLLQQRLTYSLPSYQEGRIMSLLSSHNYPQQAIFLLVQTCFHIAKMDIEGNIILIFEMGSFDTLLSALGEEE